MAHQRRNRRLSNNDPDIEFEAVTSSDDGNDSSSSSDSEENHSENQDRDLSPEEMDKLVQFQDITGIEDLQICRALLESKDWDLEATAREQLNLPQSNQDRHRHPVRPINPHAEAPEVMLPPRPNNGALAPPFVRASQNGPVYPRGPGSVVDRGFFSWTFYILTWPFRWPLNIAFRAMTGIFQFVASLFGLGPSHGRPIQFWPPSAPFDPLADVQQFRRDFDATYGGNTAFFEGTYSQVLEKAKQDLQFLLVYLHSPSHADTDRFCRTTLSSPQLVNFLAENNTLFWGCSVESGEGYRVSQALRESTYPFMAVVVLRQNRMMIVGRFEGFISAEDLLRRLVLVIRDNEAYIVAARAEREERQINQQIRLEQDAALQESLRQDQEKERKKQEEEDRKRREEEEERRIVEEAAQKKETLRRMKIELANLIPDEPEPNHPDTVRILIKLPDGQRLERRFLKSSNLKSLFYYVFCHPDSPDEFDITTNFPRKVVPCRPENIANHAEFEAPTFEEAGLSQSAMLFVNDLDA